MDKVTALLEEPKLPWKITEEHKQVFKEAYEFFNGNIPHCGFSDVMLKECGLPYGANAKGF